MRRVSCVLEDAPGALKIPFRLTQADLANMIGTTRVQVNQVLAAGKSARSSASKIRGFTCWMPRCCARW